MPSERHPSFIYGVEIDLTTDPVTVRLNFGSNLPGANNLKTSITLDLDVALSVANNIVVQALRHRPQALGLGLKANPRKKGSP